MIPGGFEHTILRSSVAVESCSVAPRIGSGAHRPVAALAEIRRLDDDDSILTIVRHFTSNDES
jgi:hypothetical protein